MPIYAPILNFLEQSQQKSGNIMNIPKRYPISSPTIKSHTLPYYLAWAFTSSSSIISYKFSFLYDVKIGPLSRSWFKDTGPKSSYYYLLKFESLTNMFYKIALISTFYCSYTGLLFSSCDWTAEGTF